MAKTNRDKFFTGINQAYDALVSAMEATEVRGHRVSRTVLEEARKGEREVSALARKWVDEPTSFFENISAVFDVQSRAQMRALELARDALQGTGEYRSEIAEGLQKFTKANSAVSRATADATRDAFARVTGGAVSEEEHGAIRAIGTASRSRKKVAAGS
jgi:hypothetical protein